MISSKAIKILFTLVLGFTQGITYADLSIDGKGKKIVVFTDYEADDSVAIGLLLQYLKNHNITDSNDFMFGALLSNQYRKKALVKNIVTLFGYPCDTVYAGTGGIKEPFEEEGKNILSQTSLEDFLILDQKYLKSSDPAEHQDDESILHFKKILEESTLNSVDVLILTNPIDFVKAIDNNIDLMYKIRAIYMMGGWFGNKPSFNWNMYPDSVVNLLQLMETAKGHPHSPILTIFSSHFFAQEFNGYVNRTKFPQVIEFFDANTNPIITHFRNMVTNWDDSMTVVKSYHDEEQRKDRLYMIDRIGKENIGRQFTPADPATMIGYLYPKNFIVENTPSAIRLTVSIDDQGKKNSLIDWYPDTSSNVFLVGKVNISFFNEKLIELMNISN